MNVGTLQIELMANIARLQADMDKAKSVVSSAMSSINSAVGGAMKMLAGLAAGLTVAAFAGMVKGAIDVAAGLHDMSIQTGASVAALMQFKAIGATSDTTAQSIAAAMNKAAKGMAVASEESKGVGQAIKAIGIDFTSLKAMAPDQQMLTVAKALDKFEDGASKSAVAMTIYGKEGAKMLPFLKDLADASDEVSAKLTKQEVDAKAAQAAMADDFGDNLTKIHKASEQWKKDLSLGMLPALYEASQAFIDVTSGAGGFKETISKMAKDGTFAEWTRIAITGVTYLADSIQGVGRIVSAVGKFIGASVSAWVTVIGGAAEAMNQFVNGEYSKALETVKSTTSATLDIGKNFMSDMSDTFSEKSLGAKIRDRMDQIKGIGAAAKEAKAALNFSATADDAKALEATAKAAKEYEKILDKIRGKDVGQDAEFQKNVAILYAGYVAGKQSLEEYVTTIEAYIKQQKSSIEIDEAKIRAQEQLQKFNESYSAGLAVTSKILSDQVDAATKEAEANEELVRVYGMTKSAIELADLARLESQYAQRTANGLTIQEIETLEKLIAAKKRSAAASETVEGLEEQKRVWESIDKTAHDTFISIFESGKSAFDRLKDTLKNGLLDMLYQMTIKKWIFNVQASVGGGSSAGQAGGAGDILATGKSLWDGFSGAMSAAAGGGITSLGNMLGSQSISAFGAGLSGGASTAGATAAYAASGNAAVAGGLNAGAAVSAAMPVVASVVAAYFAARAIAGQYRVEGIGAALNYMGVVGGVINRAFGMDDKKSGATTLSGSFGANGFSGTSDTPWTQKGGWFRSDKSGTDSKAIDAAMAAQFTAGYDALKSASADFAKALGIDATAIATRSQALSIAVTGDKEKDAKAIEAFFIGVGNSIATELIPNIGALTKAGESAAGALQRVAGNYTALDSILTAMGSTFGAIGIDSLAARERLIDLSGGIEAMANKASAFSQTYFTEAERIAPIIEAVNAAMAALGLSSVQSKDDFKGVVMGIDKASEAGAVLFAKLMDIAPAFAQAADYTATLQKATEEKAAADAKASQDLAKQLSDDVIARAKAAADMQRAYEADFGNAMVDNIGRATEAAKALRDFNDSLKLGNLSTLSKDAQYALARRQYASNTNDQSAANALLQASQGRNGAGSFDYAKDFAMVTSNLAKGAAEKDAQVSGIINLYRYMATNSMDGSHAGGLDYVPFDGYRAELHKGERVQTAAEARNADGMTEATGQRLLVAMETTAVSVNAVFKKLDRMAPEDVMQIAEVPA